MNNKKRKLKKISILLFTIGLIFYILGFVLLFSSSLSTTKFSQMIFNKLCLNSTSLKIMKIVPSPDL